MVNLNERQLWQLARVMGQTRYTAGQMVFMKGDPGDTFYIVQEGTFSVFEGESRAHTHTRTHTHAHTHAHTHTHTHTRVLLCTVEDLLCV